MRKLKKICVYGTSFPGSFRSCIFPALRVGSSQKGSLDFFIIESSIRSTVNLVFPRRNQSSLISNRSTFLIFLTHRFATNNNRCEFVIFLEVRPHVSIFLRHRRILMKTIWQRWSSVVTFVAPFVPHFRLHGVLDVERYVTSRQKSSYRKGATRSLNNLSIVCK